MSSANYHPSFKGITERLESTSPESIVDLFNTYTPPIYRDRKVHHAECQQARKIAAPLIKKARDLDIRASLIDSNSELYYHINEASKIYIACLAVALVAEASLSKRPIVMNDRLNQRILPFHKSFKLKPTAKRSSPISVILEFSRATGIMNAKLKGIPRHIKKLHPHSLILKNAYGHTPQKAYGLLRMLGLPRIELFETDQEDPPVAKLDPRRLSAIDQHRIYLHLHHNVTIGHNESNTYERGGCWPFRDDRREHTFSFRPHKLEEDEEERTLQAHAIWGMLNVIASSDLHKTKIFWKKKNA